MSKNYQLLIEKIDSFPTLPVVATKINELINDPDSSATDIAAIMKRDQVLTVKVLRLVNSPYYGIPGGVSDVQRAIAFLGFNTLAQLVMGVSVFSMFELQNTQYFNILEFWRHALSTAITSEQIAKIVKYPKPEECFTAGLLHDLGKLVIYKVGREDLEKTIAYAQTKGISFVEAEKAREMPFHTTVGEQVANRWRLPQVISLCIRYHHQDVSAMSTFIPSVKTAIQIVQEANLLSHYWSLGNSGSYAPVPEGPFVSHFKITETQLEEIREKAEAGSTVQKLLQEAA